MQIFGDVRGNHKNVSFLQPMQHVCSWRIMTAVRRTPCAHLVVTVSKYNFLTVGIYNKLLTRGRWQDATALFRVQCEQKAEMETAWSSMVEGHLRHNLRMLIAHPQFDQWRHRCMHVAPPPPLPGTMWLAPSPRSRSGNGKAAAGSRSSSSSDRLNEMRATAADAIAMSGIAFLISGAAASNEPLHSASSCNFTTQRCTFHLPVCLFVSSSSRTRSYVQRFEKAFSSRQKCLWCGPKYRKYITSAELMLE